MQAIILVFVGGALGSILRFWLSGMVARRFGEVFPFGTLVVNLAASAAIGLVSGFLLHFGFNSFTRVAQQFLVVGLCGGLSTFSSLSLQTWNLLMEGRWFSAILNIVGSTIGCLLFVAIGWNLIK